MMPVGSTPGLSTSNRHRSFPAKNPGRPKFKGRQRNPDRGLPSPEALEELARTYLTAQHALWPELVKSGIIPPPSPETLTRMADQFRRIFLDTEAVLVVPHQLEARKPLAVSYIRYSDSNSNPRSLDQQLKLQLERARVNGHFIPWDLVFADAAVSATTSSRRGYELAKIALEREDVGILYFDEVGRLSRNNIESLQLGRLIERHGKRMIGISDGFDSTATTSKMQLAMYGMVQEWFVDQLRSKVKRGMDDAFARGTNITALAVGYRLDEAKDASGRPLLGKDGAVLKMKVIDLDEAKEVRSAFDDFVNKGISPHEIARGFNARKVGGLSSWDYGSIRQLLKRELYFGVEIHGRTTQVKDPETGKIKVETRPREQWKVRRLRELQIIPFRLWKAAQAKLERTSEAFSTKRKSGIEVHRTDEYPSLLVRPICGSCGQPLILGQSGKYKSLICVNGRHGKKGCTFKGYKSTRLIDEAVIQELQRLFTEEFLERLLTNANEHLVVLAERPRVDTQPIESQIRQVKARRDRLVKAMEAEDAGDLAVLIAQVRRFEDQLAELRAELEPLRLQSQPPPPPMTREDLIPLLDDLRGLLSQEISASALAIRELTGPVVANQFIPEGKSRATWTLSFELNAAPILVELSSRRGCPTSNFWEYLKSAGWTFREPTTVELSWHDRPKQRNARAC